MVQVRLILNSCHLCDSWPPEPDTCVLDEVHFLAALFLLNVTTDLKLHLLFWTDSSYMERSLNRGTSYIQDCLNFRPLLICIWFFTLRNRSADQRDKMEILLSSVSTSCLPNSPQLLRSKATYVY